MSPTKILEIACFNLQSVLIAGMAGADRIELCENYKAGGLTPADETILSALQNTNVPLNVIIRPQANDFIYSPSEIKTMKQSIIFCKQNKVNGLVFGALNKKNEIDVSLCAELISLASPIPVTFHRAIDACEDLNAAIEALISLKVTRVLTSGGASNAPDGIHKLKELQDLYGDKIIIMPGGGLRSANLKGLFVSGCIEFHSSAITGAGEIADANEISKIKRVLMQAK